MFTTDNSEFTTNECATLNEALSLLTAGVHDDRNEGGSDYREAVATYCDRLTNAWTTDHALNTPALLVSRVLA